MKTHSIKTRYSWGLNNLIMPLVLFGLVFAVVAIGLSRASRGVTDKGVQVAEEAIRRAVVSCYAIEGSYPESYEYIRDNYGVAINEDKYTIHYSVFASNIMPEITVIAKDDSR